MIASPGAALKGTMTRYEIRQNKDLVIGEIEKSLPELALARSTDVRIVVMKQE